MTIIFSEKITPSQARIKTSDAFVALITKAFVAHQSEKRYAECKIAEESNKPMYAIVEKGIDWKLFQIFRWRRIYYYEDKPSESIIKDIEKDLKWYRSIGA